MSILKLKPSCKDYIWGGHRLVEEYNVEYDGDILAEAWELSCHPDGPSVIMNGPYEGKTLQDYLDSEGMEVLGTHCRRFRDFPILTKFIDARDNLSVQVHPGNGFALQNEGQYGKTEMWYVLDAEKDAFLYYGFRQEISREEFARRIEENTLLEVLNPVPVKKGDVLFIESGTLHAIGKGIVIAEIQQNSNVTYRVYDYGRVGRDGKKRDLHIEKALAVTSRVPIIRSGSEYPHVADCDYFTVDKLDLDGRLTYRMQGTVNDDSFLSILILDGEGKLSCKGEALSYRKGDSFFMAAGSGDWQIEGRCDALLTTIREKASPVRVGITIGSAETAIGLVNDSQQIFAMRTFPTMPEPEAFIDKVARATLDLLEEQGVPLDQCTGVGVGVPGTIDRRAGKVLYSNNLRWDDVELVRKLGRVIPCPVRIANDADCAALGEAVAGAGKEYSDVAMFTLGGGVGGGIILNGQVFEGGIMGGSEVGHQVVRVNGRRCTCGRRGCLEAYVSVPALVRAAKEATGIEMTPEEIFCSASEGNKDLQAVIEQYEEMLATGIVNIVNMFRPQLILLGGTLSGYAGSMTDHIREIMERDCFGGIHGMIPEIAVAELGSNAGVIGAANL
ncbi:MAG: ROK family protein [Lachnospiraceae bacterium]|nr:ROK family protein [Lachnospiraceae bacterium]